MAAICLNKRYYEIVVHSLPPLPGTPPEETELLVWPHRLWAGAMRSRCQRGADSSGEELSTYFKDQDEPVCAEAPGYLLGDCKL